MSSGQRLRLPEGGSIDRGRPLHVYDADKLKGAIRARLGRKGEKFLALDGKTYAAPVTLQGHPIYYNKALYEQAGLQPRTWEHAGEEAEAAHG